MPNSIFSALNGGNAAGIGNIAQVINDVKNFQRTFNGDPREEVQKMINDGRLSQSQFNQYAQVANQIMSAMGGKF